MQTFQFRTLGACGAASLVLALAATTLMPRTAHAQFSSRLVLRGEIGGGTMLSTYQHDQLGYNVVVQGGGRVGLRLFGPVEIQAGFGSAWFPSNGRNAGQLYTVTGGLRIAPMLGSVGWLWIDGNAGLARTASLSRLGVDAGVGFEFALGRAVGIGPFGRFTNVFAASTDQQSDAGFWSAGLSMSLRIPPDVEAPAAPRDSDGDGIIDEQDQCVAVPAGPQPDPARPGCPVRDADSDGIADALDQCPTVPVGARPDPARAGCPLLDVDNDGIADGNDNCPETPQGATPDPERLGCPDGDDDRDGVVNHADQCRGEPAGPTPDPARAGCPNPDRDHDSVPDAQDACPDRPGAPSTNPRRNGCPGLVRIDNGQIRINRPVFFATNRDVVLRTSFPVLEAVAEALRAMTHIRRVSVAGHTDDVGRSDANMDLSQRRSESVMAWLVAHGIEAGRLEAHGYGPTRPLIQGTTRAARAANRRVEFLILDPAQTPPPPAAGTAVEVPSSPAATPSGSTTR
jgi:outer membrane protein OmpA-like peptidoglycan-associated protein